jgi:diguanylate cyclase (GGDEF)-like protein
LPIPSLVLLHGFQLSPAAFLWLSLIIIALVLLCFFLTYRNLERAVEASRRNELRFMAIANSTLDAFYLLKAIRPEGRSNGPIEDFVFTYVNPHAEEIIDRPQDQILGARLSWILPMRTDGALFDQYRHVVLTGAPLTHEFPLDPKDIYGAWMRHHVERFEDGLAITASEIIQHSRPNEPPAALDLYDPLTGLPNRNLLADRLQQATARAIRYRTKVAVFLLNLDSFQHVNEAYGHEAGDQVLVNAANRLRATVRLTDTVLRMGGDEFVIIMPDIALESDMRRTAATLVAVLRPAIVVGAKSIEVTCSIGVAVYPDSAANAEELLHRADLAMYRAKCQGKNKYNLFSESAIRNDEKQCAD